MATSFFWVIVVLFVPPSIFGAKNPKTDCHLSAAIVEMSKHIFVENPSFLRKLDTFLGNTCDPGSCPPSWIKIFNSCFYFPYIFDGKTIFQSMEYCNDMGGRLFEPANATIAQKVYEVAYRLFPDAGGFWLGVHDLVEHGRYVYQSDGERIHSSFEFDVHSHFDKGPCVAFSSYSESSKLNSIYCYTRLIPICEINL